MPKLQEIVVWLHRAVGAGIAIVVMEVLARVADEPLARVPFVTSIVLVLALPTNEGARPIAVIGGHALSSIAGLLMLFAFGPGDFSAALAIGLAVFLMLLARTVHPPAGIDAALIPTYSLAPAWLLSPVLVGAVLLVAYALMWRAIEDRLTDWLDARTSATQDDKAKGPAE
jgi:CBS-domain-containing membrane protein